MPPACVCSRLPPPHGASAALPQSAATSPALRPAPGPAGNYVKMVHNGIEYGDMQLIAEAYDVLRVVSTLRSAWADASCNGKPAGMRPDLPALPAWASAAA